MTSLPPQDPQQPWPAPPPQPAPPAVPGQPVSAQPDGSLFGQPHLPPGQFPGWPPAGPPPNNNLKWILIAVVTIVAIIAATVIMLNKGSGTSSNNAGNSAGSTVTGGGSGSTSAVASAGDTGPITIITDEPTCAAFASINNAVYDTAQNGWAERDPSIPASDWTPEQRNQYQAVGAAIGNAADQFVTLAKQTPHRIVRELYEQSIAYGRAYAESIPHLTPRDDYVVGVYNDATIAISNICDSITFGSAAARSGLADPSPASSQTTPVDDPAKPARFLTNLDFSRNSA